jgi:amidase
LSEVISSSLSTNRTKNPTFSVAHTKISWKAISKEAQGAVLESIPSRWRLDIEKYKSLRDVTSVPYTSGIMTKDQLEITELTAGEIVKCESREWKAVQVLEAFAARAAIAHQLVCLMSLTTLLSG